MSSDEQRGQQHEPACPAVHEELREKICFFYKPSLGAIHAGLSAAEKLLASLFFAGISAMMEAASVEDAGGWRKKVIRPHGDIAANTYSILENVFDDYAAAYHCLTHGFFKQTQAILRGTIEAAVQLAALGGQPELIQDSWVRGERGFADFSSTLESLKGAAIMQEGQRWVRLRDAYNLACEATHARKNRMRNRGLPSGLPQTQAFTFDPFDALFTIALFAFVLDTELPILKEAAVNCARTAAPDFAPVPQIQAMFDQIQRFVDVFASVIARFAKGYLIHDEHLELEAGKRVLYSISLDGTVRLRGKRKPKLTLDEQWVLVKAVNKRLCRDFLL